jgi:hypothetical membrane protein
MYERRQPWFLTTCGGMGVIVPVVAFTFIILSILTYPPFSLTSNALSDLGVVSGITATLFNFGLYVSGLMSLWFAIGLYQYLSKNALGKLGAMVFGAASLALEGIGWAPEGTNAFNFPWHYFFSVLFFALVPIALLVIVSYFLTTHEAHLAGFTLLIAVIAAAPWVLYFAVQYVPGVAIPELFSTVAASAWSITVGWRMYQAGSAMYKTASKSKNSVVDISVS